MHTTKNDLPGRVRKNIIDLLQNRLAESVDLSLQCKQAHWNIKGENFIALHKLFDKIHEDAIRYSDLIAERIVQLGGTSEGTTAPVMERSKLPQYPLDISDERSHLEALSSSLAYYGSEIRSLVSESTKLDDAVTADILIEIVRRTDKQLWMVESHLERRKEWLNEDATQIAS